VIKQNKLLGSDSGKFAHKFMLDIEFVYPSYHKDTTKLRELQRVFMEKFFTEQQRDFNPKTAIDSLTVIMQSYYDSIFTSEVQNIYTSGDSVPVYYLNIKNEVVFNDNKIISFLVENEGYEGGAHPSHETEGYIYNVDDQIFINENDIEGTNYKKNIAEILYLKIKEQYCKKGEKPEDIGFDKNEIIPNNNLTVNEKGITYHYNEYEIAPYYLGNINIFIPFNELEIYLKAGNPIEYLYNK
jgi:hypothetical protein